MEDLDQKTTNHKKQVEAVVEEGKGFTKKPVQKSLCPETSFTDENPEKLSVMLKNITSKNEARDQLLKSESMDVKPRTRLRRKLQAEIKSAHEYCEEIMMIDDAFSEGTVHTSKGQYCSDNEKFIDVQGVARFMPEIFCTNKQVDSEDCSVSRIPQEYEVHMKEEDLKITPELNQVKKYLQTYKEQTIFLQNINEKLMTTNKRLQEDLEDKEAYYQKSLSISKDILKEKRTIQNQLEHMKAQSKKEENKDVEFARLQKRSQVLSDITILTEASKSLQFQSYSLLLKAILFVDRCLFYFTLVLKNCLKEIDLSIFERVRSIEVGSYNYIRKADTLLHQQAYIFDILGAVLARVDRQDSLYFDICTIGIYLIVV